MSKGVKMFRQPDDPQYTLDLEEEPNTWVSLFRGLAIVAIISLLAVGAIAWIEDAFAAEPMQVGQTIPVENMPACQKKQTRDELVRVWRDSDTETFNQAAAVAFGARLCGLASGQFVIDELERIETVMFEGVKTKLYLYTATHLFHGQRIGTLYSFTRVPIYDGEAA